MALGTVPSRTSNGEVEGPHRSAPWRRGRTISQRPRRQTASASRPPPTIVRGRPGPQRPHQDVPRQESGRDADEQRVNSDVKCPIECQSSLNKIQLKPEQEHWNAEYQEKQRNGSCCRTECQL